MRWLNINPKDIKDILITHQDTDHVGAIEKGSDGLFSESTIYIGRIENEYLEHRKRRKVFWGLYKLPRVHIDNKKVLIDEEILISKRKIKNLEKEIEKIEKKIKVAEEKISSTVTTEANSETSSAIEIQKSGFEEEKNQKQKEIEVIKTKIEKLENL